MADQEKPGTGTSDVASGPSGGHEKTPEAKPETPGSAVDWLSKVVPLAVDLGWTMAVLYGRTDPLPPVPHLPSEHELQPTERTSVERQRLSCLLEHIGSQLPAPSKDFSACVSTVETWTTTPPADLPTALTKLNVDLLRCFACVGRPLSLGYQLGRSLRDTANPPASADGWKKSVVAQLDRDRVAILQEWLKMLAPNLPVDAAGTVSVSLGRWSDFCGVTLGDAPGGLAGPVPEDFAKDDMRRCLLPQGDVWLDLLTGVDSTENLLTPEAYVSAAENAIDRAARMAGAVLRHYWKALVVLLIALGGVLYLGAAFLSGPGRVWTDIAGIAGSLGVTAKGIGSTMGKLVDEGAKPVYLLEEVEAKAWAITTLPTAKVNTRGIYELRRSGISRSARLGRS